MDAGRLGQIATPAAGNRVEAGRTWCADNSIFGGRYPGDDRFYEWLRQRLPYASTCRFVVAPDVVCDAAATLARSAPHLPRIRAMGYPVALVAQNGLESLTVPWDDFDVLFLGGDDEWKLGPHAAALAAEAKRRGKWVHMGRVNSRLRLAYAASIGCDSADGTFIAFGPDRNLPRMLRWIDEVNGVALCAGCGYAYGTHDPGTLKCHPETADKAGRRGKWRVPPPHDTRSWREIMRQDAAAMRAKVAAARAAYVPETVPPPQVPARPPQGPGELAGYQGKQAISLGRKAVAAGFAVHPLYWRAGDGTEGCGVWLAHDALRAFATWTRKPGSIGKTSGWGVGVAYAWRTDSGRIPTSLNHTDLENLFGAPPT